MWTTLKGPFSPSVSDVISAIFRVTKFFLRFRKPLIYSDATVMHIHCWFRMTITRRQWLHDAFNVHYQQSICLTSLTRAKCESYPWYASKMTRNTLNHCLKFALRCIFCHICYGKISEKNVNTFIKVKLFVSKTSNSYFKGLDFFQMLLASHR